MLVNNRNDARLVRSHISTWDSHSSADTVRKRSCDRNCLLNSRVSLSLFWIILSLFWHGAHYQIRYSWLFVLSPSKPRWEKSLECISGAKIFFLAFAMKFILHAGILQPSSFSLVPKQDCKRARAWISHGQFFTMKTSQAIWRLGRGEGVDLIYVRRLAL